MADLEAGRAEAEAGAERRCRSCGAARGVCDGLCFGFWKNSRGTSLAPGAAPPLPVCAGDVVRRGKDWNCMRYGSQGLVGTGRVVAVKSWAGHEAGDAVVVEWEERCGGDVAAKEAFVYRWGALASSGRRLYDVEKVPTNS